jgi:hypothetical protein
MNRDGKLWMRLLWTAVALAGISWQARSFVTHLRPEEGKVLDFFQEWASARNYFEGVPIYTHQADSVRRYLHGEPHAVGMPLIEYNAHPPTAVLFVLPLGLLSYSNACLLWSLWSLLCLGLSGWIIQRLHPNALTLWSVLPCAALLLWCNPFRQQMNQGQLNLVLLLLLTGTWAADRTDRPWLAGGLLGAAMAIKLFPGYVFVYFAARRQWRPLAAGASSFLLLTALTILVLGSACYRDYATVALPAVEKYRVFWPNLSLAGFWHKLFNSQGSHIIPLWQNPALAWTATLISDAIVTVLTAWFIWRSRTLRECDLAFALTILAMLLVSPITWDHYFTLLFLPLFLLWCWTPPAGSQRVAFWFLLISSWLPPLFYWRLVFRGVSQENWHALIATPRQTLTALSMQTYILLALFVFTILVIRNVQCLADEPET